MCWVVGSRMLAPDSLALVVLLDLGAVALTWLTISKWKRIRSVARIACLLGMQLLVVITCVTALNTSERLITTWSALVGSTSGMTVQVHGDTTPANRGPNASAVAATSPTPSAATVAQSTVTSISIKGSKTGYDLPAQIYLPGGYDATGERAYPVIELLAGFPGSIQSWTGGLKLKETLDGLIAAGKMPPMIAVMPSQNTDSPHDSECVNATSSMKKHRGQAATYLGADVPAYLKKHYRVSDDRANWVIGGYSTGGYCAAALALQHPDTFGSVLELSGYDEPKVDNTTGRLFATKKDRKAVTVTQLLSKPHPHLNFFLFAADDQLRDKMQMKLIADAVPSSDTVRVVTTPAGGHSPPVWRVASKAGFEWIGPTLH